MNRWIKRNPTEAAIAAGAVGLLLANLGGIRQTLNQMESQRAIATANTLQIQQMQLTEQKKEELQEIANARYDSGCEMVVSSADRRNYKALVENGPVRDGGVAHLYKRVKNPPVGAYLPAGMTVCDAYGNTAIIANNMDGWPVATEFATTTDKQRIAAAMDRLRAKRLGGQL
jgi:hypothetical protein